MIIGIDHGYGCMKMANFIFTTGITEYEKEPYTSKTSLDMTADTMFAEVDGRP